MTLHLSLLTGRHALQVGDRLLTTGQPGNASRWDEVSNKMLLIETRSGSLLISYSGLAHIGRKPTDQWLAERITGVRLPTGPDGGLPTQDGGRLTTGADVHRGINELFAALMSQPPHLREMGLELLVSGFARTHARRDVSFTLPVGYQMTHDGNRPGLPWPGESTGTGGGIVGSSLLASVWT